MFNMNEIGRRIASLRKEKNMTQVELADKLGISYQAVSNWERGDSMPDIAKLSELSQIFEISIDNLLGNEREVEIVKTIINKEPINYNELSKDDLEAILPIVKPEQFDESFKNYNDLSFEQIVAIAPFLDEIDLDKIVLSRFIIGNYKLIALAPFLSEKTINKIYEKKIESNEYNDLIALAPFIDSSVLNKHALNIYEKESVKSIVGLLPFIDSGIVKDIYKLEVEKGNTKSLMMLMPFI